MLIGSDAAELDGPARHERAALAFGAEAEVLELQQHGDREAVVDLGDVDVGRAEPGPPVQRVGRRLGRQRRDVVAQHDRELDARLRVAAGCPGRRPGSAPAGWARPWPARCWSRRPRRRRRSPGRSRTAAAGGRSSGPPGSRPSSAGGRASARCGLSLARLRQAMAMAPRSFSVVPYSIMWRWAISPKICPGVSSPYGQEELVVGAVAADAVRRSPS